MRPRRRSPPRTRWRGSPGEQAAGPAARCGPACELSSVTWPASGQARRNSGLDLQTDFNRSSGNMFVIAVANSVAAPSQKLLSLVYF